VKPVVRILVTGGTGFLGAYVERELAKSTKVKFKSTFLTRKDSDEKGRLKGDLTSWNAGLDLAKFKGKFDAILHMAGVYDLRVAREDATMHNIAGTHAALAIAQVCEISTFIHISTVAVTMPAGLARESRGVASDELFSGPFPDAYAETKSNAEKMVRQWESEFPKRKLILRPGILVGDTNGSAIPRIDGPYHAIDAFRRMRPLLNSWRGFLPLPGQADTRVPLVPVDCAAEAICRLSELFLLEGESGPQIESYYVADDGGPTIDALYASALRALGLEHRVELMPNAPQSLIKPLAEWLARLPREELEYVLNLPKLDTSKTVEKLGSDFFPSFEKYEPKLWSGYHAFIQNR
jgi:UDP-glucose 4-epimerase